MSGRMRIGELLLLQERIDPWLLSHTLNEQASSRLRLVSLLVSRAQLDPDDGALLLSEQLGYAAALQRHLERRDPSVLGLLPRELGARWVVLPLGRARTGAIIVVARDPTPVLAAALEHAMKHPVVLAVTPCVQLERLVRAAYGGPGAPEEPLPVSPPTLSDIGTAFVDEDTPLPIRRPRTVSYMFSSGAEPLVAANGLQTSIERTLGEIDRALTVSHVERLVMSYIGKRWSSSLLARIDEDRALGQRGHQVREPRIDSIQISLVPPSLFASARERRGVIAGPAADADPLRAVIGTTTAAAPVLAGGDVVALLAVGEPIEISPAEAIGELDRLVDALGAAYDRFSR